VTQLPTDAGIHAASAARPSRALVRFAILLSVIAGAVDAIGFLSLGKVFAAHITGNLVMISAAIFRDLTPAQALALPVFMIAVAATWHLANVSGRRGRSLARLLMMVQVGVLIGLLAFCVVTKASTVPDSWTAGVAASLAVGAMGLQHALLRLSSPKAPSTAVMTGNLTNAILSFLDLTARSAPPPEGAAERLRNSLYLLIGFAAGCVGGAVAVYFVQDWSWTLPVVLAASALALR
jgi:uncharacterized membrane protein YoaK (UPF0700 family)